jgi:hypothetical protein
MAAWIIHNHAFYVLGSKGVGAMALIQCPDCGKEISDTAPTCINCGRVMRSPPAVQTAPAPPVVVNAPAPAREGCFLQTMNVGCGLIFAFIALIVIIAIVSKP